MSARVGALELLHVSSLMSLRQFSFLVQPSGGNVFPSTVLFLFCLSVHEGVTRHFQPSNHCPINGRSPPCTQCTQTTQLLHLLFSLFLTIIQPFGLNHHLPLSPFFLMFAPWKTVTVHSLVEAATPPTTNPLIRHFFFCQFFWVISWKCQCLDGTRPKYRPRLVSGGGGEWFCCNITVAEAEAEERRAGRCEAFG